MTRQPYLPTFQHLNYSIGALVTKERPALCEAVGKIIALWSHVDNEIGCLFGLLLGTESDAALHVFLSLRRSSSQREAIGVAADLSITGKELLACQAIMLVYKSLEAQRNDLAHGCLERIAPDNENILFWIDLKHHVHFQTETLTQEGKGIFQADRHKRLKENLFVYRLADLNALHAQMEEFWYAAFYFNGYLREPHNPGRAEEFQRLCSYPQIQQKLSQLNAGP